MEYQYKYIGVSGFWSVGNKHGNNYQNWFKNTLNINIPYIIYTNQSNISKYRRFFETHIEYTEIESFLTNKFRDRFHIHITHSPSIELLMIWNEKMNLLKKTHHKYLAEWYFWIDAGLCSLRNSNNLSSNPWPNHNIDKLNINCMNFSSSVLKFDDTIDLIKNYYHFISGSLFAIHHSKINLFFNLYYITLEYLLGQNSINTNWKYTDQCVWTYIYKYNPHLFNHLCYNYGSMINYLDKK